MSKRYGAVLLFLFLLVFWFILASRFDLATIIIGFVVSSMIVFYNYDLVFNRLEVTKLSVKAIGSFIVLAYVLLINIIKSNIQVAIIVLSPSLPIHPGFASIRQPLKKEINQALYANAITLTPGTLTVDMDDKFILVHGLKLEHIHDLEGSKMEQAFVKFEEASK